MGTIKDKERDKERKERERDDKLLHETIIKYRKRAELAAALGRNEGAVKCMRIAVWLCELERLRLIDRHWREGMIDSVDALIEAHDQQKEVKTNGK